jgi:hypothetical protein
VAEVSVLFFLSVQVVGIALSLALGADVATAVTIALATSAGWFMRGYFDRGRKAPTYTITTTYDSVDARGKWGPPRYPTDVADE